MSQYITYPPLSSGPSGTGAANQLAFWSDPSTLTSSSSLTWDGSTFSVNGDVSVSSGSLSLTGGNAADPALAISGNGLYDDGGDLALASGGTESLKFTSTQIISFKDIAASGTAALGTPSAPFTTINAKDSLVLTEDGTNSEVRLETATTRLRFRGPVSGFASLLFYSTGGLQLGELGATDIHQINTTTPAPDVSILTLTNGPVGTAGNPAVYVKININGVDYVFPGWAV